LFANWRLEILLAKVFRKETLESLTPGILEPSSPTKLEKIKVIKTIGGLNGEIKG